MIVEKFLILKKKSLSCIEQKTCDLCIFQTTNYELRLQKSETEIKSLKEENRMLENKVLDVLNVVPLWFSKLNV
jgi:hypothetical protein